MRSSGDEGDIGGGEDGEWEGRGEEKEGGRS
jgi:hypothetical protein